MDFRSNPDTTDLFQFLYIKVFKLFALFHPVNSTHHHEDILPDKEDRLGIAIAVFNGLVCRHGLDKPDLVVADFGFFEEFVLPFVKNPFGHVGIRKI